MAQLVYYSSETGNTKRFIEKLGEEAIRIPISPKDGMPKAAEPYVLVVPSYCDGEGRGAVPKAVVRFLNDAENRSFIRGVIGAGNLNFGQFYCYAARIIADKCNIPLLHRFEMFGTPEDVSVVKYGLIKFWRNENGK